MTTALEIVPDAPPALVLWTERGRQICCKADQLEWELADWAQQGQKLNALKRFCELHGMNYTRTKEAARVAENLAPEHRVKQLSFAMHYEVVNLTPQKQNSWLQIALKEKLSVTEFRERIRQGEGEQSAILDSPKPSAFSSLAEHVWELHNELSHKPPEFWTPTTKQFWKNELKPLVELWEGL